MFEILSSDIVANRIFYPRKSGVEPTTTVDTGSGHTACYFARPNPDAGTILHFHGNGELASDYWTHLLPMFLGSGLNVCFVDYRGYGWSEGSPSLIGQLQDNVRLVRQLDFDLRRLIVYGRSLGSLFAIDLVEKLPDVAGLVIESGIASILEDWPLEKETRQLGKSAADLQSEVDQVFDARKKLAGYSGELLVLHTENDGDVEVDHAERLHAWCGSDSKRLVIFENGDHSSILAVNSAEITRELSEMGERLEFRGSSPHTGAA